MGEPINERLYECGRWLPLSTTPGFALMLPETNTAETGPSATKVQVWLTEGDLTGTPYRLVLRDPMPPSGAKERVPGYSPGEARHLPLPPVKIEGQPCPSDDPAKWKWPFSPDGALICDRWREHAEGCDCYRGADQT